MIIVRFGYMGGNEYGIGGECADTNDFYAFLSWGWPVGIMIFTGITLTAFGVACLFRVISNKRSA